VDHSYAASPPIEEWHHRQALRIQTVWSCKVQGLLDQNVTPFWGVWCADLELLRSTETGVRGPWRIKFHRKRVCRPSMWTFNSVHASSPKTSNSVHIRSSGKQLTCTTREPSLSREMLMLFGTQEFASSIIQGGKQCQARFFCAVLRSVKRVCADLTTLRSEENGCGVRSLDN